MKYVIALLLISLSFACTQKESTSITEKTEELPRTLLVSMYSSPLIDRQIAKEDPYKISFEVEKVEGNQYLIQAEMKLFGGSFYVSPHSTRDFSGKFTLDLSINDHVKLGDFTEMPKSEEVIDPHPFVNGRVNWVQKDTKYEYQLEVLSKEDFDVGGKFFFTIEPKCTLEEVPFMIKYRSGVLTIEPWMC